MVRTLSLLLCLAMAAAGQTTRTVQATGSATVSVTPDQAMLDVGVVTNASTAQESAAQNATQTASVIGAVKSVLAGNGTVQTAYYSVSPRYANNGATIVGYTTSNTLRVVMTDLSIVGKLIDAANGAGANTTGGLSFGLQDSDPTMQQALAAATKQAMAHAAAIATGLGAKLGTVVSAQEGATYSPIMGVAAGGAATVTPILTGTVNVTANVTLVAQLQ